MSTTEEAVDFTQHIEIRPEVYDIPVHQDDRGFVYCVRDHLFSDMIQRTYIVENYSKGLIRAWHGHKRADTYMHVLNGSVKLAAMNMNDHNDIVTAVLTERKPQLFYIPAGFYNGAVSLTDNTKILVYSTLTFDRVQSDDYRLDWTVNKSIWQVENR
jgi:dTDP-4-dehydrorhamnose 3,5-epimerase-like enzyme